MELFGYDLKLLIVAFLAILTWIFIVAGLATPFAENSYSTATLFEYCTTAGNSHSCDHTYLCSAVASTAHGGAAFGVMSILAWCGVCAIFIGRIFFPAFFDRPQMPTIIFVSLGVIEFMMLIAWACAFGALHKNCNGDDSFSNLGYSCGASGVLLLFAWFFIAGIIGVEWKMPATKSFADNYKAVGSVAPQHVAVASDNLYGNPSQQQASGNASGYAEVSQQ